ncbi:MAG: hypothetical protein II877_08995 [Synergistaceae bacterium]|nr:hypothetical protein [Synergistaceae bacterium]
MSYDFYGWRDSSQIHAVNDTYPGIITPLNLYDALIHVWCEYTCTPRLRHQWTPDNPTLGQCAITSFLAQDIFGGKVYGVPLEGGNVHCYNVVGECVFDLTSEQFSGESLDYSGNTEQLRQVHFMRTEKKERYEYLKAKLKEYCGKYCTLSEISHQVTGKI